MKNGSSEKTYRIQEFAELAGVTVRTLHHYDHIRLLRPRRTSAGYRVYGIADLERLEQIVALRFLGLPLKQIQLLLDREALALPEALRLQRSVLEQKRCLLDRAIEVIREAESSVRPGHQTDAAVLKKIIEVIEMQNNSDWMMKYYDDDAQAKIAARGAEWTPDQQAECSRQWMELIAEVRAALHEDPASERVQGLANRWLKLVEGFTGGDPAVTQGLKKLYADQSNWPASAQQQTQAFMDKEVWGFIHKAIALRK
ncbi:MAG TPA: MerR family transcriptional regulator [Bryobacteraceae bacterium]|nr:MerR family transcriptional regulator [Bryobacteraceae bacterium]